MVDYKMMQALQRGQFALDSYDWILGTRPRHYMEMQGSFYMRYAQNIKGFYPHVPEYVVMQLTLVADTLQFTMHVM